MYEVTMSPQPQSQPEQPQSEWQVWWEHFWLNAISTGAEVFASELGREIGLKKKTAASVGGFVHKMTYKGLGHSLPPREQYRWPTLEDVAKKPRRPSRRSKR